MVLIRGSEGAVVAGASGSHHGAALPTSDREPTGVPGGSAARWGGAAWGKRREYGARARQGGPGGSVDIQRLRRVLGDIEHVVYV